MSAPLTQRWFAPGWIVLLGVITGIVLALAPASPAAAHAALLRTSPGQGAVVEVPPEQVVLTFSEPVEAVADQVRIIGPNGARADRGGARVSGERLRIPLRSGAPRGTYLVSFRVISADGHPVSGGFSFSVGAPSAAPAQEAQDGDDPVVVTLLAVMRYAGYAGLVALLGGLGALAVGWPARLSRRGPGRLATGGIVLVAAPAVAEVVLQAPYLLGGGLSDLRGSDVLSVVDSRYGYAHLARLALLAAAVPLLRRVSRGTPTKRDQGLLAGVGVAALLTWPLSGHPAGSPLPWLSVLLDVAHLAAASVWLGGLLVLVGLLLRRSAREALAEALPPWLRTWSKVAMGAVAVLALAGVAQAVIEVRTLDALVTSRYGLLVLAKAGLLAAILAAASFARRLARGAPSPGPAGAPAPDPPPGAPTRGGALRRLVAVELTLAAVVLAVTAVLTQTTPARTDAAANAAAQPTGSRQAELSHKLYTLRIEIDPARVGDNQVRLYAATPGGKPLKVLEWKVTAALPSAGIAAVDVPVVAVTGDHATGRIGLPKAGRWVFRFTLRISEIDQATVKTTVRVR
ncbi:MAG: copper resistance protein CopC [Micromonosporaceae bacterium]|nr:copper resistance protein CopC [Micromonosporaceae bacterium]